MWGVGGGFGSEQSLAPCRAAGWVSPVGVGRGREPGWSCVAGGGFEERGVGVGSGAGARQAMVMMTVAMSKLGHHRASWRALRSRRAGPHGQGAGPGQAWRAR